MFRQFVLLGLGLVLVACPQPETEHPPEENPCSDGQVRDEDSETCVAEACGTTRYGPHAPGGRVL